jgi:hypothetical protein
MLITKFKLYESNMGKFNFDNYIVTYDTDEEALNFVEQMKKKNYDFYGLDNIVNDIKKWDCFIYASDDEVFVLARSSYFESQGYKKMTVGEAIYTADTQNQNDNTPVIRWYKKGKLGKNVNN